MEGDLLNWEKLLFFKEPCLDMSKHELNDYAYLQHSSKDFDGVATH